MDRFANVERTDAISWCHGASMSGVLNVRNWAHSGRLAKVRFWSEADVEAKAALDAVRRDQLPQPIDREKQT